MFEYLELNMWKDGTEHCTAYAEFKLDEREIWYGTKYSLCNNHVKNTWEIQLWNTNSLQKVVDSGKEETLTVEEFIKWLLQHDVKDGYMEYLRCHPEYVARFPKIMGTQYITINPVSLA